MATKRKTRKTKAKAVVRRRARFLRLLHEFAGNITRAAAATPWSRQSVYELMNRDPKFAARVERAIESGNRALEDEAHRRAYFGVEEPVFHKGKVCGHITRYSDTMLIFTMKARMREKYGDRSVVDANVSTSAPVQFYLPDNGRDSEGAE